MTPRNRPAKRAAKNDRKAAPAAPGTPTPEAAKAASGVGIAPPDAADAFARYGVPALLVLAVFWCAFRPLADPDCWFHMAFGDWVLSHGWAVPKGDVFSHTAAGAEWISSGWLASVLMAWLWTTFGEGGAGILAMATVVPAAAVLVVYWAGFARLGATRAPAVGALLLMGVAAAGGRYLPRPDVFSQLGLAATLALLLAAERQLGTDWSRQPPGLASRAVWPILTLVVVNILWVNLHAGFPLGRALILLFTVQLFADWRRDRNHSGKAALVILIPLLLLVVMGNGFNPYGSRILALGTKIASIPKVGLVYEWMPMVTTPALMPRWPMLAGTAALAAAALVVGGAGWRAGLLRPWHAAGILGALVLAVAQRRQVGMAAIAVPALLIPSLPALGPWLDRQRVSVGRGAMALAAGVVAIASVGLVDGIGGLPKTGRVERLPVIVSEWLAENRPPGKIYNSYNAGGYLLRALGPQTKVFIDGRLDVYPHQVWLDSLAVEDGSMDLDGFCRRYGTDTFVLPIDDAYGDKGHLASRLSASPDWRMVHFDDRFAVFGRAGGAADLLTTATTEWAEARAFRMANPLAPRKFLAAAADPATRAAAIAEAQRALEQSNRGASALALAAALNAATGGRVDAESYLAEALSVDRRNPLAQAVAKTLDEIGADGTARMAQEAKKAGQPPPK